MTNYFSREIQLNLKERYRKKLHFTLTSHDNKLDSEGNEKT
jgi:hypothetical protein